MGGFRIPGHQSDPDPSIDDGTLTRAKSPTPGHVCATKEDDQCKDSNSDLPRTEQTKLTIVVFFFGGYKSSQPDMDRWLNSAQNQRADVTFHAYPYPPDALSVPRDNDFNVFDSTIKTIRNTEAEKIFIVGHSSGCAAANEVAAALKGKEKITLVALDGFMPNTKQLKLPTTQVWGAISGKAVSLHHDDLQKGTAKSGAKNSFHEFTAHSDCTTKVALHFSLVNTSANDKDLKDFGDIKKGYNDCVANLCWL